MKKMREKGTPEEKRNVFKVIEKGLRRGDLMGCSITVSVEL